MAHEIRTFLAFIVLGAIALGCGQNAHRIPCLAPPSANASAAQASATAPDAGIRRPRPEPCPDVTLEQIRAQWTSFTWSAPESDVTEPSGILMQRVTDARYEIVHRVRVPDAFRWCEVYNAVLAFGQPDGIAIRVIPEERAERAFLSIGAAYDLESNTFEITNSFRYIVRSIMEMRLVHEATHAVIHWEFLRQLRGHGIDFQQFRTRCQQQAYTYRFVSEALAYLNGARWLYRRGYTPEFSAMDPIRADYPTENNALRSAAGDSEAIRRFAEVMQLNGGFGLPLDRTTWTSCTLPLDLRFGMADFLDPLLRVPLANP